MTARSRPDLLRDLLLGFVCIGFVAASVAAVWGLFRAGDADQHAQSADRHLSAASSAVAANAAGLAEANAQLRRLGGTPVATPSPVPGMAGARGPGPTGVQIQAAVEIYCASHAGCTGTPSERQVQSAVAAFCAAGACQGAAGEPGASGQPGQPGAQGPQGQQGAQGNGPTDAQITAAVAAYCTAHGDCTGPAGPQGDTGATGPQGDPGPTGATGRGIASIDCTGLGLTQLVIHYDDGTDQTVPCTAPTDSKGGHS